MKGYFSCYCDMTQFTLTYHMVIKPFLLLGLAAEYRCRPSMRDQHCERPSDVYDTDRRTISWQRLRRSAVEFYSKKTKNSLFEPPFRALRGDVRTPSMARWKCRGRLYIRHIELLSLSPTVETLWAEIGRSRRFSKGVGHFERRFQREGGIAHQPLLVSE